MSEKTYYQRNRDVILNRAKDYYENDKERLREQARDKYRKLYEEQKNKKREYGKYFFFALITESNIINDKHLHGAFSFGIFLL